MRRLEAEILCGGSKPCRAPLFGVNLGGWLVLEGDLVPDLMGDVGDEWTFIQRSGGPSSKNATEVLRRHWESFVTEEDLDTLAKANVTHVRVPIGYWLLDYDVSDGFVDGSERYLFRLLALLRQRGMKAVLDLHALPGVQMASVDSTGRRSHSAEFFQNAALHQRGRGVMEKMAKLVLEMNRNVLTSGVIVGLELVNEPDWDFWDTSPGIRELYEDMVPKIRKILPKDTCAILLSFAGPSSRSEGVEWLEGMRKAHPEDYTAVFYDAHIYHSNGDNDAHGRAWRPDVDSCKTCCRDPPLLQPLVTSLPVVVGEFSVETGFREGTADSVLQYFAAQQSLWAATPGVLGSFFWNFKVLAQHQAGGNGVDPGRTSLLDLLRLGARIDLPAAAPAALAAGGGASTVLCPDMDLSLCPSVFPGNVLWTDECHWQQPYSMT